MDDETLKEIGRFAIEFSTLDELVTALATAALECAEWGIAQYLTERLTSGRKLEQIKAVCDNLAKAYGLERTDLHQKLSACIVSAKEIVADRNVIIHGELVIKQGERPIVQLKKESVEVSPEDLAVLTEKIDHATTGLFAAYSDFMDAVYRSREMRAKK